MDHTLALRSVCYCRHSVKGEKLPTRRPIIKLDRRYEALLTCSVLPASTTSPPDVVFLCEGGVQYDSVSMSAYIFDNINLYRPQQTHGYDGYNFSFGGGAPQPAPTMMAPLEQQQQQQHFAGGNSHAAAFLQHQQTPRPEFVCNVSDDDTVERDIDLEIEARIRSLTLLSDEENVLNMSMELSAPTTPDLPRTMSQRMLSSLQKNKLRQTQRTDRSVLRATCRETHSPPPASPAPVLSETSFYQSAEELTPAAAAHDGVLRGDDSGPPPLTRKASTSATDRLEARISKSFMSRQDSITSAADANDFSSLYSGRRTYPAESVKKNDQRLSEGTPFPAKPETSMSLALEKGMCSGSNPCDLYVTCSLTFLQLMLQHEQSAQRLPWRVSTCTAPRLAWWSPWLRKFAKRRRLRTWASRSISTAGRPPRAPFPRGRINSLSRPRPTFVLSMHNTTRRMRWSSQRGVQRCLTQSTRCSRTSLATLRSSSTVSRVA